MSDDEKKKKEEENKENKENKEAPGASNPGASASINLLNTSYFGSYDNYEGVTFDSSVWSTLTSDDSWECYKDMND